MALDQNKFFASGDLESNQWNSMNLGWIDFSDSNRKKTMDVLRLFQQLVQPIRALFADR